MQRMSYAEKKASEISMPLNAPNLRFKLFFYFNKKRVNEIEKSGKYAESCRITTILN